MGTGYRVRLAGAPAGAAGEPDAAALQARIDALLEQVNDQMSTYREDSELSRFNRAPAGAWFPVSADTARVVLASIAVSDWTGGAFDATAGPLVDLWSFGPQGGERRVPADAAIAATLTRVGYDKIQARLEPTPALLKTAEGVALDLSGIAKGWAVDRVAALLEDEGWAGYLVDIGGELRVHGRKDDGSAWTVAVERPIPGVREVARTVQLTGAAVATSGDYRNFFEVDGRVYSHIVDPRTGRTAEGTVASATVVMENCMRADGLATALVVMGAEEALTFAEDSDVAVYLIERRDGALVERASSEFRRRFPDAAPGE